MVESCSAVGHTRALSLSGMWSLRPRVEGVCTGPGSRAWGFRERRASFVVRDVRLAGVGKEGENGGDALRRGRATCRNGDEESKRRSGT